MGSYCLGPLFEIDSEVEAGTHTISPSWVWRSRHRKRLPTRLLEQDLNVLELPSILQDSLHRLENARAPISEKARKGTDRLR